MNSDYAEQMKWPSGMKCKLCVANIPIDVVCRRAKKMNVNCSCYVKCLKGTTAFPLDCCNVISGGAMV